MTAPLTSNDVAASLAKRGQELAALVIAHPIGASRGTRDCIRQAEAAGIPVVIHEGVAA